MRAEIESLDRQIAFKEGEERRLRAEIGAYQARLEAVPGIESEWVALTRDYDTLQASLHASCSPRARTRRWRPASSSARSASSSASSTRRACRVKPYSPNRMRINLLGTLAGLGLGVLLVGLAEYRDSTMRSEADVLGAIDLPVLVLLPFVTTEADVRRQRAAGAGRPAAVAASAAPPAPSSGSCELWKFVM